MSTQSQSGTATALSLMVAMTSSAIAGFDVRSADTTSPNSPITGSADFFQSSVSGASWRPPSIELLESAIADPDDAPQYDSYVAIACGPSVAGSPEIKGDGFQANPGDLLNIGGDPFAVPNQVRGVWYMDPASGAPQQPSCPNALFGGRDALFLARLSFRSLDGNFPNETITLGSGGIQVDIRDAATAGVGSPATDSLLVRFTAFGVGVGSGVDGGSLTTHPMQNPYELLEVITTAGPVPGGTARWQIHDLYVVVVPGPSGVSLLVFGSFTALIRRRPAQGA